MRSHVVARIAVTPVLVLGLTSCNESATPPTATGLAASSPSHVEHLPAVSSSAVKHRIVEAGSRIRPFSLPSFQAFTLDPAFTEVAVGTVTATRVVVGDVDDVHTVLTLTVERARTATPGSVLYARESGGVVRLEQVAESFRGHVSEDTIRERKDDLIDYSTEGSTHSRIGDRLFVVLGGRESDPGGRYVAAALRKNDDGSYSWSGTKPNAAWTESLSEAEVEELLAR